MVHELPEAQSLALDAANVLVKAAATDAWPAVKGLFQKLFRRWDGRRRSIAEEGLNLTAEAMADRSAAQFTAQHHVRTWHNRILALLAEHPGALDDLRAIAGSHPELRPGTSTERDGAAVAGVAGGSISAGPR
jgi:hypothetical protein